MKYKLIKKYPGSPEIGHIDCDSSYVTDYKPSRYPEFWEKVEELDYEIIESKKIDFISVVKRLSDGIFFALGDKIICQNSHDSKPREIIKIELNKEGNIILFTRAFFKNGVNISKAILYKPLLTTEDGKEIFKGDSYWYTYIDNLCCYRSTAGQLMDWDQGFYKNRLAFSTKELCNAYNDQNKPKYSEKELYDFGNEIFEGFVKKSYSFNDHFQNWKLKNKKC